MLWGGKPKITKFWDPIEDRIVSRLAKWRCLFCSRGRLALANVVLTSIPLYHLFTLNLNVYCRSWKVGEAYLEFFFPGEALEMKVRLIWWIGQYPSCRFQRDLGAGNLVAMNMASLLNVIGASWMKRNSLWRRIIASKYQLAPNKFGGCKNWVGCPHQPPPFVPNDREDKRWSLLKSVDVQSSLMPKLTVKQSVLSTSYVLYIHTYSRIQTPKRKI